MNVREQLASDMGAAIAGYDSTFELGGRVIPCVRRDVPNMMELQDAGGFIAGSDYWLVVAKSEFPGGTYPASGDLVNRSTSKIKETNGDEDPFAVQLTLHVGAADE